MIYPTITKGNLNKHRLSPYVNYTITEENIVFANNLYNTKVILKTKKTEGVRFIYYLEIRT